MSVSVSNITVSYQRRPAVHHVSGRFECGVATAIVGPNGAGKSTLMHLLLRLVEPASGFIRIDGVDLPGQSVQGGVFQVLVCLVVIADVRHSGAVKPERAVLADRPGGIRGLDLPG